MPIPTTAGDLREPWKGFIGQFNSALEKCTQEWVLGLDCDEVVSGEMRVSIHRVLTPVPQFGSRDKKVYRERFQKMNWRSE
jgi:hypothetical protein